MALSERSNNSNVSGISGGKEFLYGKYSASQLLTLCEELIETYNPSRVTPTTHATTFLKSKKVKDENVDIFLKEVFYGIDRHNEAVRLICKGFYHQYSGQTIKTDFNLYCIVIYLLIFRIDELRFSDLKRFIYASEGTKMIILLQFIFDQHLHGWIKNALSQVYDHLYVQNHLINSLVKKQHKMMRIIDDLSRKSLIVTQDNHDDQTENQDPNNATGNISKNQSKSKFKPTKPKPFNFTQRLPRQMKQPPILIPLDQFHVRAVPKTTYDTKKLSKIELENQKRKEKILEQTKQKYAFEKEFKVPSLDRPTNFERIRDTVEKEITKTMEIMTMTKPVPAFPNKCPVRINTATILREDAVFQKEQADQAKRIKEFEFALHDEHDFENWRLGEMAKDDLMKQEEIIQRRIDMKETQQLAKDAVLQTIQLKKVNALQQKQEKKLRTMEYDEMLAKDKIRKQNIAQEIQQSHENATKAVENVIKTNKNKGNEEKKLQKKHEKSKQKSNEIELKQKRELIKQIQAMEKEAHIRASTPKEFDPSTTAGQGLLCELSVTQLQTKLQQLKSYRAKKTDNKRKTVCLIVSTCTHVHVHAVDCVHVITLNFGKFVC